MGQTDKTIISSDGMGPGVENAGDDKDTAVNEVADTVAEKRASQISEPTVIGGSTVPALDEPTRDFDLNSRAAQTMEASGAPVKRSDVASLVGQEVGEYEILSELGRGGMGVVYKARDKRLDRLVALKMILAGAHADSDSIQRFRNEARAVAHLKHPNIVQVFEISEHEGLPYFALEFVEGASLDGVVRKQAMESKEAARIVADLAMAMQYAHDEGIIHRDLKPANVLMSGNSPLVTDFGLARQVQADDGQTKTGTILGTPGYMSPEQAMGKTAELTPAADQYSLGAVLYRLLAGRAPFVSSRAMDTIMQVIKAEPVPLRQLSEEVPKDLETICLKAISKDPASRYADCRALAEDLKRFIKDEPISARPISSAQRLLRWYKRNTKIGNLVATSFGLLAALAGLMAYSSHAIGKERDNVKLQEQKAQDNLAIAVENEERANANALVALENQQKAEKNEAIAKEQALKIVKTMQSVLVDIDGPLSKDPNFAKTRLQIMKSMSDAYNDLEIELHTDVKSQAIPTFMAMRFKLVGIFGSLNEGKLANDEIKKVYELGKQRIALKDGVDAARSNLVKICLTHATITEKAEGIEAGKPFLDEALSVARDIILNPKPSEEAGTPPLFELKFLLSNALQSVGVYHYNKGELTSAAPMFQEAGAVRREVLAMLPDDAEFAKRPEAYRNAWLSMAKLNARRSTLGSATVLLKAGKTDEGFGEFQKVLELAEAEYKSDPSDKNEQELGKVQQNLGFNYFKAGRVDDAIKLLEPAEETAARFAARNPDDYDAQYHYSVELYRLATVMESKGQDEARTRFGKCVTIREKQWKQDPNLKNETMLMVAYARNGNPDKAVEIADRLSDNEKLEGKMRVDIARAYVQSARFVEEADKKELLIRQSLTTLQRAIVGGYSDKYELTTEPDLKPLQELQEFRKMLAAL